MPYAKSDSKKTQCSQRNRYLKLSLKKNKIQLEDEPKLDRSSDIIELDDSFDRLQSEFHASVSFNCSKEVKSPTFNKESKPSIGGWSPAQHIICATPRHDPIPTTPKDTANESYEKCSINKIQQSQKKLLSDLYGETWKSIPSLFKTLSKKFDNFDGVSKKLQFDEDEKDNNIRHELKRNKELYLTSSDLKRYETNFGDSEKKSKKKLFTEKVPSTPDIRERVKSRNVNSTTKKTKIKGMSVTELVKTMNVIENDNITNDGVRSKLTDDGVRNKLKDGIRSEFTERTKKAIQYRDNYKTLREQLTRRLYQEFNRAIFDDALDADMPVLWDGKLRSTAGSGRAAAATGHLSARAVPRGHLARGRGAQGGARPFVEEMVRLFAAAKGHLSARAVPRGHLARGRRAQGGARPFVEEMRLRDTLVHELCHAATWLVDAELRASVP
ncbi:Uncharacterized protein OBRU01_12471 [Operophtera brumata]|uniref:Uncharacterized protein n=1 Tax=Operophtera brumata TaxID=104452 RepID=A0A0L7LA34_OPEBR|nr:Uncharacterized protein OBRU01_12471 [Operophtera brumata]